MQHRAYGYRDDPVTGDGDTGFVGVDARRDPGQLTSGLVADAQNMEFRQGVGETRRGFEGQPWGRDNAIANIEDPALNFDNLNFDTPCGFGTPLGATEFSDPGGANMLLLAVREGVWKIIPNAEPALIPIEDGVGVLTGPVEFVQCFDRVIMLRAAPLENLVWNPALDFSAGLDAFRPVAQTAERNTDPLNDFGDGTQPIPPAQCGALLGSRLWLGFDNDQVAASDILDYTRFSSAESQLRANAGKADTLVAMRALGQTQLVAFCDDSIFLFGNAVGDLSTLTQGVITRQHGLAAKHAVAEWGNDLWFLAGRSRGVYSLGATAQGLIQAGADPISGPIQKYLDRVNWGAVDCACATSHDGRFYLAVPIDGANYNNAILVYDGANQAWAGLWKADFLDVFQFVRVKVGGSWRLGWFTGGDGTDARWHGALVTLGDDIQDWAFGDATPILSVLKTRGYGTNGGVGWKHFQAVDLEVETFYPSLSADIVPAGRPAQPILANWQPNRRGTTLFAGKPVDLSNADGGLAADGREDYAVLGCDFPLTFGAGVQLDRKRRQTIRRRIRARGPYAQLNITNTRGQLRVLGASVHFTPSEREDLSR